MLPFTAQDIAGLRAQGWSDYDIQNATLAPQEQSSSPVSSTLKAHAGGILGGGGGSILGALAGSEVPGIGNLIGAIVGGALGGAGGSYLGQKGQQAIEPPAIYNAQQEEAEKAEQEHPIESGLTDIIVSGLASGGLPNPAAGVRGVINLLGKLGGKELSHEGANVAINSLVNPAINTGIDLATGQGMPSLGQLGLQAAGGALFGSSWLGRGNRQSPIEEPEPEINDSTQLPYTERKLLGQGSQPNWTRPHTDVESTTSTVYHGQSASIKGLLTQGDEVQLKRDNGDVNGHITEIGKDGIPVVLDEVTGKPIELTSEEQDQFKLWLKHQGEEHANTEQKSMEMVRDEQTRPSAQVAEGKSSGVQSSAGKEGEKSSGLTEEQRKNLNALSPEEQKELEGMKLNSSPKSGLPYGFWLSPSGEMHPVGSGDNEAESGGHDEVAKKILKSKYNENPPNGILAPTAALLNKGWVRMVKPIDSNFYMAESNPISKSLNNYQKRAIRDYAIENNVSAYHVPGGYGRYETIHEPESQQVNSAPSTGINNIANTNELTEHILSRKANVESYLKGLANTSWHPLASLAKHLLDILDKAGLKVPIIPGIKGKGSHYWVNHDEIRIDPNHVSDAREVLHEVLHALTARKIPAFNKVGKTHLEELEHYLKNGSNESVKDLIKAYLDTVNKLGLHDKLFKEQSITNIYAKEGVSNLPNTVFYDGHPYGISNLHEFIAESFSNKKFQELLNNIPTQDGRTIWQKVVDAVKGLLGVNAKDGSMLERVIRSSSELAHQERPSNTEHYESYKINAPPKEKTELPKDRYMGRAGRITRAAIDKLHDLGTKPAHIIADAAKMALNKRDELLGKWKNPIVEVGKKLSKFDRQKLNEVFSKEQEQGQSFKHMLTNQKQREFYNVVRAKLNESGKYRIDINEPINQLLHIGGKTFYIKRGLKQNPHYWPGVANRQVMQDYRSGKNTEQHDKIFDKYNQQVLHMTPDQSVQRIDNWKKSIMTNPTAHNVSRQDYFNANRKEAGVPLPPEFRESDPVRSLERYFERSANDVSHYEHMETPEVLAALGQANDAWGKDVEQKYGHGIAGMPEAQNVTNQWIGERRNPAGEVEEHLSSVLSSMFISGPSLEVHKIASNLVGAWSITNPLTFTKALGHAVTNLSNGYKKAVAGNVMKLSAVQSAKMFDTTATVGERLQALGRTVRKVATLGDLTTKFNASLMQNMSEVILKSKLNQANDGCITCQKFLRNLDPTYTKGKEYSEQELQSLSSTAANYLHGTGDIRSLPAWMLNDSEFSGFFSLAHWSIAKTNSFMKDIWEPATRGDIKPLLTGAFGAAIGGYLIKELRQDIQGKKNPIPSLGEIAASDKGLAGNPQLLMYNTIAAFQYAGFGGLLSQVAKYPFDAAYKNNPQGATFPLDEIVSDLGSTVHNVQESMANDPNFNFPDMVVAVANHIFSTDIQLSRIALNQGIDSGLISGLPAEKKELSDKLNQLRRFDMVEGLPYNDIDEASNPYTNIEQKKFKMEQNPEQAVGMIPDLIQGIISRYHNNPDVMWQKLKALKQNDYDVFPSMKETPLSFMKYLGYLNREQGPDVAQQALVDYMHHKAVNEEKARVVP